MPRTFDMWSATEQKVMTFTLARRDDDGDGLEEIVLERVGDDGHQLEAYHFSPHTAVDRPEARPDGSVDFSLEQYVKDVNRRHSHQLNDAEVE